jgi:U6 snRNA-associated Sm-like protein LSm1
VRGENVLLLGEIDLDKDDDVPIGYEEGEIQEVFRLKKEEEAKRKVKDRVRGRMFGEEWGGEMENSGEVLF